MNLSVGGKQPIGAWVPSLDDDGNGTTTLTDLVGSNDGTLTNMDPATDWVADTAAGGVRALDFDGVDDRVSHGPGPVIGNGDFSASVWFYRDTSSTNNLRVFSTGASTVAETGYALAVTNSIARLFLSDGTNRILGSGSAITNEAWQHVVATVADDVFAMFVNGVAAETYSIASLGSIANNRNLLIGQGGTLSNWQGRIDDLRLWNVALTPSDVAYLYDSGAGRGVTGPSGSPRRRRMMMQRGPL
jgi:hypothetical protein